MEKIKYRPNGDTFREAAKNNIGIGIMAFVIYGFFGVLTISTIVLPVIFVLLIILFDGMFIWNLVRWPSCPKHGLRLVVERRNLRAGMFHILMECPKKDYRLTALCSVIRRSRGYHYHSSRSSGGSRSFGGGSFGGGMSGGGGAGR